MVAKLDISTRITNNGGDIQLRATHSRPCLIQYNGESLGRRYLLDVPEITIGRATTNSIVILDDSVSREHAKILSSDIAFTVEDLASSNGTFIQDSRLRTATALKDGDMLRVGNILLKFFARDNIEHIFHDTIYRMATIDEGTQLFNKKYLLETLESEFRRCRVYNEPLSIIYFDLDFFKNINDLHGHNCGDYILRESARIAKSCVRAEDIVARFGGEEFVAVLPNVNAERALEVAERIRTSIENHEFAFEGKQLKQTVSMGVSQYQPEFKTATDLLNDADRKLYTSKRSGRNRVTG